MTTRAMAVVLALALAMAGTGARPVMTVAASRREAVR